VVAILVGVLKCRTRFWKRTAQESFQQSLVEIGSVVSEEKIFFKFHPPFFLIDEIKKKIFSSETTEPISTKLC
jgi:UV DNA damage repair endonuclease